MAGTDLREGTPTLPLLLAAREDEVVRAALAGGPLDGALVRVAATGALERSREVALDYACECEGEPRTALPAARSSRRSPKQSSRGGADRMAVLDRTTALDAIREKVEAGERLDLEDGLTLLESDDLLGLGELADTRAGVRGGTDEVYFVQNLYLNQTNVCRVKCKFCAFATTRKQEHAYTITTEELVEDALRQRELTGFTEIHMVNGENPHVGFDFYVDTTRSLHEAMPGRPPEALHGVRDPPHDDALRPHARAGAAELKAAGLGSLPGGGAEVFADRVRRLSRPARSRPRSGSTSTTRRTGSASRRTARCSTATSRPTRSASTTCCACASSRTAPAASWPSSRSPSIPRTPSSSGAAAGTRPARTI